jgi:gliding motility-associated-like protein
LYNLFKGIYSLMITDANGCENFATISVLEPGVLGLSFNVVNCDYGANNGSATALVAGGTAPYTFVWGPDPIAYGQTLTNIGTGTYHVTVTDANGCTAEGVVTIVTNASDIWVPNVFSPNSDGINDFFAAFGLNLSSLHMRIYDRWGELVYETNSLKRGWDGKYKGEDAAMGVYVYTIEAGFLDGSSKALKGNLTLMR